MDNGTTIIEQVIYEYPSLKAAYRELKFTSSTTTNSIHTSATNKRSDPTANAAIRELPPDKQRRYAAVHRAIAHTRYCRDSAARIEIIDYVYWKRTHNIIEAAEAVSRPNATAARYQREFIDSVQEYMGLSDCEGCLHWRRILAKVYVCHYCYDVRHMRVHDGENCYSKNTDTPIEGSSYYNEVV